jgi:hypothetical protein
MSNLDFLITQTGNFLETFAFNSLRAYLSINAPWTNAPILKQIIDIILKRLLNILFTKTEYGLYVLGVTQVVNEQNKAFKDAMESKDEAKILEAARNLIKLKSP